MPNAVVEVLLLLALSLASLAAGVSFWTWPEKCQSYSADLDGSIFFLGEDLHRRIVKLSGLVLIFASYVALVAAAFRL